MAHVSTGHSGSFRHREDRLLASRANRLNSTQVVLSSRVNVCDREEADGRFRSGTWEKAADRSKLAAAADQT
jgi:hypothetical protein